MNDPRKMVLHDVDELINCFDKGWTYPHRPIKLNTKYPYKLLAAANPDDFSIQIDDRISATMEEKIEAALQCHKSYIKSGNFGPICITKLKEMLPVAVKDQTGNFHRGEVNCAQVKEHRVNVYLVDLGEDKWVAPSSIYPPSIDLLRFPKLSLMCRLAQVVPLGLAPEWPAYDYRLLLEGKESSIFSVSLVDRGTYEVYLECDGLNMGYEMVMNKGLADLVPLGFVENEGAAEKKLGKYPRLDFSEWIGQKLSVFGTKVSKVGKRGHIKIHLQLDTSLADSLLEKIENLPESNDAGANFSKEVGDAVLVRYGGEKERYRATIIQKSKMGYLVQLVDYGDFVNIQETDLFKIPDELVAIAEAATPCFMVELLQFDQKQQTEELKDKIVELAMEKNLYCQIGHSNYADLLEDPREVRKCVVTLATEDGKPFYEILNLPQVDYVHNFTHKFPSISESLAPLLLGGESSYFPDVQYEGLVSCVENENSVWLHLEGDDARAEELTEELTEFYLNWKNCPRLDTKSLAVGTYVGAQQNSPTDDGTPDPRYYRAKITAVGPGQINGTTWYTVMFLDYGNVDVVDITQIKPLPNYFGKEKCFALQIALPVEALPQTDEDVLYEFIYNFTVGLPTKVHLQPQDGLNYAWLFCADKSLAHSLLSSGLVKLKIKPAPGIPNH